MGQLGISNIADEFTLGMVYDMLTESANDQEKYTPLADQSDIDAIFGRR